MFLAGRARLIKSSEFTVFEQRCGREVNRIDPAGLCPPRLAAYGAWARVWSEKMHKATLSALVLGSFLLSGCVYGLAASAVGAAARSAGPDPAYAGEALVHPASETCRAQAATHGVVHIIDVERRSHGTVRVYGTVENDEGRRAFECDFRGDRVTGFRLRQIGGR
jgi:hypothetical protein